jgi:hypothetical protein
MSPFDYAALYIFGRTKQSLRDGTRESQRSRVRKIDRLIGETWMKVERSRGGVEKYLCG